MRVHRLFFIAALALGGFWMFTPPAFAHHPIATGDVVCSTDGNTVVVSWYLQNSETVGGTNRTMTVNSAAVNHGTLSGIHAGQTVLPQPLPGSTVNGSTTLPSTATGSETLSVVVSWPSPGPQNVSGAATVNLPGSCPHPTTTTTRPTTTTTRPTTTTTAPATTTTAPPVTTTVPATTTSLPGSTTTVVPHSTTSVVAAPTTTQAPPPAAQELARTGGGDELAFIGAGLGMAGLVMRKFRKK